MSVNIHLSKLENDIWELVRQQGSVSIAVIYIMFPEHFKTKRALKKLRVLGLIHIEFFTVYPAGEQK